MLERAVVETAKYEIMASRAREPGFMKKILSLGATNVFQSSSGFLLVVGSSARYSAALDFGFGVCGREGFVKINETMCI